MSSGLGTGRNEILAPPGGASVGGGGPIVVSTGSADGQLKNPRDVDVDSSGNVFVADNDNNRIQKFSNTGSFIRKWGVVGALSIPLDAQKSAIPSESQDTTIPSESQDTTIPSESQNPSIPLDEQKKDPFTFLDPFS